MATSELQHFLRDVDENILECTICFKRLQNPKSLSCLHSFCLACIEDWVKSKDKLTCPTCSKSYPIPEGGLQKLPPNTFLNSLLETIEQIDRRDQIKCVCAKGVAKYYCQECRHYLCCTCSEYHKIFPISANHKLHKVEDVRSMTPQDFALLHPPLCLLHNKPLEFYCRDCKIPICINCTIMDHNAWEGKHRPISISEAFQTHKETLATLKKSAYHYRNKLQDVLNAVIHNATNLQHSKDISLKNIDKHVQEMLNLIKEKGDELKSEVHRLYKKKRHVSNTQIDELNSAISHINSKLRFLNQLLKCDEATAMQSSDKLIIALKDSIKELPYTEPNDNGYIQFCYKDKIATLLRKCDIGFVNSTQTKAECFEIPEELIVTQGHDIVVKITKVDECEIDKNQLNATWTQPSGETNITQVEENDNGDLIVTTKCTSPGICKLHVYIEGEPITQSPIIIKVEKGALINSFRTHGSKVEDVVICKDDSLLVSCFTDEMYRYKQSGEYIDTIKPKLGSNVEICRMYQMNNGDIVFGDVKNRCIRICKISGHVIKSIGKGLLSQPAGIHVDEASNMMYVADWTTKGVLIFDIQRSKRIMKVDLPPPVKPACSMIGVLDVTLTKTGNLLVLEFHSSRLLLFDNKGRFINVLVESGDDNGELKYPGGVVVDEDDNIIVASQNKLQLFNCDGKFIRRIDKNMDITTPWGLSIVSYNPSRVAVTSQKEFGTISIFEY